MRLSLGYDAIRLNAAREVVVQRVALHQLVVVRVVEEADRLPRLRVDPEARRRLFRVAERVEAGRGRRCFKTRRRGVVGNIRRDRGLLEVPEILLQLCHVGRGTIVSRPTSGHLER